MKTRKIIIALTLLLFFVGCKKEDTTPTETRYVVIKIKSPKSATVEGSSAITIKYTGTDGERSLFYTIQTSNNKSDSLVVAKDMVVGTTLEVTSATVNGYSVSIYIKSAEKLGDTLYFDSSYPATNKIVTYKINSEAPYVAGVSETGL